MLPRAEDLSKNRILDKYTAYAQTDRIVHTLGDLHQKFLRVRKCEKRSRMPKSVSSIKTSSAEKRLVEEQTDRDSNQLPTVPRVLLVRQKTDVSSRFSTNLLGREGTCLELEYVCLSTEGNFCGF